MAERNSGILLKIAIYVAGIVFMAGCSPGEHSGHIYIHDPNHYEVVFDVPMSMEIEQGDTKIKASSLKTGFFEEVIKFILLRPR